jgi:hypothetical protein
MQKAKKSKKQRKHGRGNRGTQNLCYKNEHRRERNKLRRLNKHLVRFAADGCACNAADRCKGVLGVR